MGLLFPISGLLLLWLHLVLCMWLSEPCLSPLCLVLNVCCGGTCRCEEGSRRGGHQWRTSEEEPGRRSQRGAEDPTPKQGTSFSMPRQSPRLSVRAGITSVCLLQNAGAIIGKGGANIKRLRSDVSIPPVSAIHLLSLLPCSCIIQAPC